MVIHLSQVWGWRYPILYHTDCIRTLITPLTTTTTTTTTIIIIIIMLVVVVTIYKYNSIKELNCSISYCQAKSAPISAD